MAIANVLLIRYDLGWTELTDAASIAAKGRREKMVTVTAGTPEEARAKAQPLLDIFAQDRARTTIGIAPATLADTPYYAFGPGDTITVPDESLAADLQRVRAIAVRPDRATDQIVYTPELASRLSDLETAAKRSLQRMAQGSLDGRTRIPSPTPPAKDTQGATRQPGHQVFTFDADPLIAAVSPDYRVPATARVFAFSAKLSNGGTTATVVLLGKNVSTTVATLTIPALATEAITRTILDPYVNAGDALFVYVTTAGAGAARLVADVEFL